MPHPALAAVKALFVDAVDMAHQPRQIGLARVQHQMEVIAHRTAGHHLRVDAVHGLPDDRELYGPVVIAIDQLAPVTLRGYLMEGIGRLES